MIDLDELDRLANYKYGGLNVTISRNEMLELIRRLREAERDAELYRWIRDHAMIVDFVSDDDNFITIMHKDCYSSGRTLEQAISTAIAKEAEHGQR